MSCKGWPGNTSTEKPSHLLGRVSQASYPWLLAGPSPQLPRLLCRLLHELCLPATDAQESSPASVDEQDRSVKVHGFPGAALAKCHAVGAQSNRLVCSHSPRCQGPSIQVSAGLSSLRRLQGRVLPPPPAPGGSWLSSACGCPPPAPGSRGLEAALFLSQMGN